MMIWTISDAVPPTLVSQVAPQSADLGDSHKVKFSFNGTGPFDFKVKRNGKEIPKADSRVKLVTFDEHGKLMFSGEGYKVDFWYQSACSSSQ